MTKYVQERLTATDEWMKMRVAYETPVKCAIFGSVLFSVVINLTTWLELAVVPCYNNWFKRMSRHITLTELQKDYTYAVVMKVITYTLVMFVIPFLTLIIVNCRIIIALRRSSNLRQQHTNTTPNAERNEHITLTELQKDYTYAVVMKVITYTLVMFVIPFLTLIIVNCRIIIALRRSSNLRQQHTNTTPNAERNDALRTPANSASAANANSVRDRSVTLMLLAIVAMFLECNGGALRTPANSASAANANSVRDRSVTLMLLAIVAMFLECNGGLILNSHDIRPLNHGTQIKFGLENENIIVIWSRLV
uniref:G_PROTEIN_RECEP_F1_2 domain-containing protein n=1 Tax=Ascaris lumbricoides TaxID=6252 RepID=A0A0M3IN67_ASCLU